MALAAAIFALVVIGALVAMTFQVAHLELRTGRNSVYLVQALEAAEAGPAVVLAEWEAHPEIGALAVGESVTLADTRLGGRAAFQPTVLRLTDALYLIRSEGTSMDAAGNVLARRLVSTLARAASGGVAPLAQRSWLQGY